MTTGTAGIPDPFSAHGKASTTFTPASPVDTLAVLRGRSTQVRLLLETLSQLGQHAIIYGERGVGKTSLAGVLREVVSKLGPTKFNFAHVNCDAEDDFASLWRKIFREFPAVSPRHFDAAGADSLDFPRTRADCLGETVSPEDIRRLCATLDGRLVVVIDEFDQLSDNQEVVRLMANTIKTLSDRRVPVTLVLLGVPDTATQLVAQHASVERNLVQIHIPRMNEEEIGLIIREGLFQLDVSINREELAYLCAVAQGLPSAAHRLGLQLAYQMLDTGGKRVTREDIDAVLKAALDRMPQSHFLDWQRATGSPQEAGCFENLLIAAALAPRDCQGWFQEQHVLDQLSLIAEGSPQDLSPYTRHLCQLSAPEAGILEHSGIQGDSRFRFSNPAFQTYVVMRGLSADWSGRNSDQWKSNLLAALGKSSTPLPVSGETTTVTRPGK